MKRGRDGEPVDDDEQAPADAAGIDAPKLTRDQAKERIRALLAARRDERSGAT